MLYGREAYDMDCHAIETIRSLGSAAVAGEVYQHRVDVVLPDVVEVLGYFKPVQQAEVMQRIGKVLTGQQIGGFDLNTLDYGCDMMLRKCKGKLMATISMLEDGDKRKKKKNQPSANTIKLENHEFKQRDGYVGSVLGHEARK